MPSRANSQSTLASLRAQYGRPVLGVFVFVLFLHDILGTHGYLAMRRTRLEIARVQADIARLNRENQQLAGEVKALRSDPHKIESIARCELGLAKPGEVIIKIPRSGEAESCDESAR